MSKKRYSIVRVDKHCPSHFENKINLRYVCKKGDCSQCRYGDTKEQMILKVAQVIRRYRKNLDICEYCDMKDEFEIAEKIVEFLGVEE